MSTRRLSPTANLLRHSRLFSLPPPLPRPSYDTSSTTVSFGSDTATTPYPTHQSIETTQASLARGDWGLKRSLPKRAFTRTTTPVIRVGAVDSIDHITDFNSATDHTLTLWKWQAMNIPLSMPTLRKSISNRGSAVSVFEDELNSTQANAESLESNARRWKYKGPWLSGKNAGEFEDYVTKKIKRRRPEFRQYLRTWIRDKLVAIASRTAMDMGEERPDSTIQFSEEQYQAEIVKMRHDPADLWILIWRFLDLPGAPPQRTDHISDTWTRTAVAEEENSVLEQGPPTTHPSAGLSYLRTGSHVPNHPLLGPMSTQQPVLSRIVKHGGAASKSRTRVLVGVGGVVADGGQPAAFQDSRSQGLQWTRFDPDLKGGAKGWVHPTQASISSQGTIKLIAERAKEGAVAVWEGQVDEGVVAASAASGINLRPAASSVEAPTQAQGSPRRTLPTKVYHNPQTRYGEISAELKGLLEDTFGRPSPP